MTGEVVYEDPYSAAPMIGWGEEEYGGEWYDRYSNG
jgi:hypothetical protein